MVSEEDEQDMIEFMSPEADVHGLGAAGLYAAAMGTEAKDRAAHGARAAAEYTTEKGVPWPRITRLRRPTPRRRLPRSRLLR